MQLDSDRGRFCSLLFALLAALLVVMAACGPLAVSSCSYFSSSVSDVHMSAFSGSSSRHSIILFARAAIQDTTRDFAGDVNKYANAQMTLCFVIWGQVEDKGYSEMTQQGMRLAVQALEQKYSGAAGGHPKVTFRIEQSSRNNDYLGDEATLKARLNSMVYGNDCDYLFVSFYDIAPVAWLKAIALDRPNMLVMLGSVSGYEAGLPPNMVTAEPLCDREWYLTGLLAGGVGSTCIGLIAPFAGVTMYYPHAFAKGIARGIAASSNPSKVLPLQTAVVNDWRKPNRDVAATRLLMRPAPEGLGCSVISDYTNSAAATEEGVLYGSAIGWEFNRLDSYGSKVLASVVRTFDDEIFSTVEFWIHGRTQGQMQYFTCEVSPLSPLVPAPIASLFAAARADFNATRDIWGDDMYDQQGALRVKGPITDPAVLLNLDFVTSLAHEAGHISSKEDCKAGTALVQRVRPNASGVDRLVSACVPCAEDHYSLDGAVECMRCPSDKTSGIGASECKDKFWTPALIAAVTLATAGGCAVIVGIVAAFLCFGYGCCGRRVARRRASKVSDAVNNDHEAEEAVASTTSFARRGVGGGIGMKELTVHADAFAEADEAVLRRHRRPSASPTSGLLGFPSRPRGSSGMALSPSSRDGRSGVAGTDAFVDSMEQSSTDGGGTACGGMTLRPNGGHGGGGSSRAPLDLPTMKTPRHSHSGGGTAGGTGHGGGGGLAGQSYTLASGSGGNVGNDLMHLTEHVGPQTGSSQTNNNTTQQSLTPRTAANNLNNNSSSIALIRRSADEALEEALLAEKAARVALIDSDSFYVGAQLSAGLGASAHQLSKVVLANGTTIAMRESYGGGGHDGEESDEYNLITRLPPHPGVVDYYAVRYDANTGATRVFMEYVSAQSLRQFVGEVDRPMADVTGRAFARQVLTALAFLHSHNVAHRNLLSDHILVDARGHLKIADLMTAKEVERGSDTSLTIVAAPQNQPPEVLTCRHALPDAFEQATKGDVWCFGLICVEVQNKNRGPWPLEAVGTAGILRFLQTEEPVVIPPHIPPLAADFMRRCLDRDPAQRWSAEQLLQHPWMTDDSKNSTRNAKGGVGSGLGLGGATKSAGGGGGRERFTLDHVIGSGAFGTVYTATLKPGVVIAGGLGLGIGGNEGSEGGSPLVHANGSFGHSPASHASGGGGGHRSPCSHHLLLSPHHTNPTPSMGGGAAAANTNAAIGAGAGGALVAVKAIGYNSRDAGEASKLRKAMREIEVMQRLDHPNIVKYLFLDQSEPAPSGHQTLYIAMEYVPGGTLKQYILDHAKGSATGGSGGRCGEGSAVQGASNSTTPPATMRRRVGSSFGGQEAVVVADGEGAAAPSAEEAKTISVVIPPPEPAFAVVTGDAAGDTPSPAVFNPDSSLKGFGSAPSTVVAQPLPKPPSSSSQAATAGGGGSRARGLPETEAAYFTREMLRGLAYLHGKGFAHRDIKPSNCLLTAARSPFSIVAAATEGGLGTRSRSYSASSFSNASSVGGAQMTNPLAPGGLASPKIGGDGSKQPSPLLSPEGVGGSSGSGPTRLKLADFGTAFSSSGEGTVSVGMQGTLLYMAPEIVREERPTTSADVWSLGASVMEMVTGEAPWAHIVSGSSFALISLIASTEELPMPSSEATGLSAECIDFMRQCLCRDPSKRPTAEALLQHPWVASGYLPHESAALLGVGAGGASVVASGCGEGSVPRNEGMYLPGMFPMQAASEDNE